MHYGLPFSRDVVTTNASSKTIIMDYSVWDLLDYAPPKFLLSAPLCHVISPILRDISPGQSPGETAHSTSILGVFSYAFQASSTSKYAFMNDLGSNLNRSNYYF